MNIEEKKESIVKISYHTRTESIPDLLKTLSNAYTTGFVNVTWIEVLGLIDKIKESKSITPDVLDKLTKQIITIRKSLAEFDHLLEDIDSLSKGYYSVMNSSPETHVENE